jgi:hypothetical protein
MKPGCNVCIHIQQLLRYQNEHGYIGRRDFRGALVDLCEAAGLHWKGEVVIPKNPQIIAQRLKLHSLMFVTGKRNARGLAPAVNDYVMIFQKPGEATPVAALHDPVTNPEGWLSTNEWIRDAYGYWRNDDMVMRRATTTPLDGTEAAYSKFAVPGLEKFRDENAALQGYKEAQEWLEEHEWLASGIWDDIQETDVLEGYRSAREEDDEKHVCPLQLEVIRRLIRLYSNVGELVLDPFMGIGSTAYVAIEQERKYVGFELKDSYHAQAEANIALAQSKKQEALPLFAFMAQKEAK